MNFVIEDIGPSNSNSSAGVHLATVEMDELQ